MSSKAENTSQNSSQQHRLTIFFRHPLLLKIVAWLGSLSFIGSTGIVWADLIPISGSSAETKEIVRASASTKVSESKDDRQPEIIGPHLPTVNQPPAASIASKQLFDRQVPVVDKSIAANNPPTSSPLKHADLLAADGSEQEQIPSSTAISIPVPAPLNSISPSDSSSVGGDTRERQETIANPSSQIQPAHRQKRAIVSQSVPATGINPKSASAHLSLRPLPKVNLDRSTVAKSRTSNVNHRRMITAPTPVAIDSNLPRGGQRVLTGLKPVTVAPLKPAPSSLRRTTAKVKTAPVERIQPIEAQTAIEIPVPPPLTQTIKVPHVAQLPQLTTNKAVPKVAPLPTIQPATVAQQQQPQQITFNSEAGYISSEFIYPLTNPAPITSRFGWRTHPITGNRRFHSGVDIGAPMGAPVVAVAAGQVVSAGWIGGYGKAIVIQHNGTQQTLYGHLSEIFVQPGQQLDRGIVIGRVGSTGNSTGPHLHFETRVATNDGWVATDPYQDIVYALDHLRQAMPFVQRDLPTRRSY